MNSSLFVVQLNIFTSISFEPFQKLAGALHNEGSLTYKDKVAIVTGFKTYGQPPTYGEEFYQYRMSKMGWDKSKDSR